MNYQKRGLRSGKRAILIALLILVVSGVPSLLSAGVCEEALQKCGFDAIITGLFGGPQTYLIYLLGCLAGYDWCLKYYIPEK